MLEFFQSNYEWIAGVIQNVEMFFRDHAYQAGLVYLFVFVFMYMSSFGLPVPEEVVLVSAGLVAHVATHPDLYPPPTDVPLNPVNPYLLGGLCFFAVISSDLVIYWLGKKFRRWIKPKLIVKIRSWVKRYGIWATALFRFTPGLRFPGHLMCGAMGMPIGKFVTVDAIAAGLTVPTQILLLAFYGDTILQGFLKFKYVLVALLVVVLLYILVRRYFRSYWAH
jgi:membrane protein DedA with SNARE-associated domain